MHILLCEKCQSEARAAHQRGQSGAIFCDHNTEGIGIIYEEHQPEGFEPFCRITWPISPEKAAQFLDGLRNKTMSESQKH